MFRSRAFLLVPVFALLVLGITLGLFACGGGGGGGSSAPVAPVTASGVFPLHIETDKHYLVDASGKPFLLHADTAWSLIADISLADAEVYLEDRRQKGFNAVIVSLLEHKFATNAPNNFYGDAPFTSIPATVDYSVPNPAYFAHADQVIQIAAAKGILVLLTPSYVGNNGGDEGWYQDMVANGATKMRNYGRYLGQRYGSYSNILWVHGGDDNSSDKSLTRAIALGIQEFDNHSLHTAHCDSETSALGYWSGETWLQVNTIYTYVDVHSKAQTGYANPMPFFLIESRYENEGFSSGDGTEQQARVQTYQALLSGAMGQAFGNNPIWHFTGPGVGFIADTADWKDWLNSPGAQSMVNVHSLFAARAWWTLVPDSSNTFLTAGVDGVAGSGTPYDRAVAAKASDGSFAIVYMPSARTVTVDLGQLAGPNVNARWYDPSNGVFSSAGAPFTITAHPQSHSFIPAAVNASTTGSGTFSDWVLVLESRS